MNDLTLETLAQRLSDLERKMAELTAAAPKAAPKKDWRRTVGMFEGSEFMAQVSADVLAQREAERSAARAAGDE